MSRKSAPTVALFLSSDSVKIVNIHHDNISADSKKCNSTGDWEIAIKELFVKNNVNSRALVRVILDVALTNSVQLPKNETLNDEEMHGIAMNKDLESVVAGKITDYTWDYYEAKTSKNSRPMLNFVLVEKRIIALISDIVNGLAKLSDITISTLAAADFVSYYQYKILKDKDSGTPQQYVEQLGLMLYFPKDKDLTVYGVHNGDLCYTRVMRNYRGLSNGVLSASNDPLLEQLNMDLLRLCDDFFTAQLGLPPLSKIIIAMDTDQLEVIGTALSENRRNVEVIPLKKYPFSKDSGLGFSITQDKEICSLAEQGIEYLPLLGVLRGGMLESE